MALEWKAGTPYLLSLELLVAAIVGCLFTVLGAGGGAWILGGIAAGAIVFYGYRRFNATTKPNKSARKLGQVLVGLSIGFSVDRIDLPTLAAQFPVFVLLTAFLLLSSGCISYLYARVESTDLVTALFAAVPGNIGVMASLAADYGKNAAIVSLVQLTRFTLVTLIVPLIANVPVPRDLSTFWQPIGENLQNLTAVDLLLLSLLGLTTYLAVVGGSKLKIPVPTLFCPLLVGLVFVSLLKFPQFDLGISFKFPPGLSWIGQILLGITIGEYWAVNPKLEKRTVAVALVPALLTFLAGFASAAIAKLLTPWDWLTCLLVTSPGGSPEMILIALVLNHDVQIVTIGHLIRLIAINLSLPTLIALANSLDRRKSPLEEPLA